MKHRTNQNGRLALHAFVLAGLGALGASAPEASARGWLVSEHTNSWRRVYDYAQGSGVVSNIQNLPIPIALAGVAGVEQVGGVTYVLTTFNTNTLYTMTPNGNGPGQASISVHVPGATGSSAEGDLGYNPANGYMYAIGNTPFTSTKDIWRIDLSLQSSTLIGNFTADDPSGIAFDNAGNCIIVDTHGNSGGVAEVLRFDVMSNPNSAQLLGRASLGLGVGPAIGLDFDPTTNTPYLLTINGNMYSIGGYLSSTPSWQFIESVAGLSNVTGLAYVPTPGAAALIALGALCGLRRRRLA